jgi:4-amino-4-deoxy-L-arabinose transferase-like glycosyltransferase
MVLAWAAAALGVLTKGIVAVFLPAAALLMYSWFRRDGQVWRRLSPLRGVPVFLLIAAPWFVGMYRAVPGFLDFFFIREHLQRYLTPIAGRQQAWWFFLPVLVVGVLPWVPSAVRALATGWRASEPRAGFNVRGFLWCWVIVTFVFFSASDSKLVPYILPLFPALGLLMASADPASVRRDTLRTAWGLVAVGVLLALFAIVEPFLAQRFGWSAEVLSLRTWLMVMAAVLIAGGVVGAVVRGDPAFAHIAISAAAFASVGVLLWAARGLTPLYSGEPLVEALPPELRSAPTYAVHQYDQTVPFYLARTTTLVQERNELDFGLQLEPWREIERWPEFEARWRRSGQALAILDQRDLRDLQRRGVPLQVRAYAGREVLVSRR